MKILILGPRARYERYRPAADVLDRWEPVFLDKETAEASVIAAAPDAEVLFVDAITPVTASLMEGLPRLRMIHSEGVAFDRIDLDAARREGRLCLQQQGLQRRRRGGAGRFADADAPAPGPGGGPGGPGPAARWEMKERCMVEGITELSACKVGLVGLGDTGRAAAEHLRPFGCGLYYYSKHRRPPKEEQRLGVAYLPLEELAAVCDIVSLHCAVTGETRNMVDDAFLGRMKPTAYLINTARGDLVDNDALRRALTEGRIAGAGLDTVAPEPGLAGGPSPL